MASVEYHYIELIFKINSNYNENKLCVLNDIKLATWTYRYFSEIFDNKQDVGNLFVTISNMT